MTSLFFSVPPCEAILSCRVMGNGMTWAESHMDFYCMDVGIKR